LCSCWRGFNRTATRKIMASEDKERITVLHLIGTLQVGGAEQQLVSLAPLFNPERFRIIVATMQPRDTLAGALAGTHVECRSLNFRMRHFISGVWRLCSLLKREKVDILHTHMFYASWYGRLAGLCVRVPLMIATDHGRGLWKKPWDIAFERFANRYTALRIAVSQDVAEILRTREGVPEDKLLVIPNGVDVERFQAGRSGRESVRNQLGLPDGAVVVGTVARLVEPKALHILIKAVAQVSKAVPQVRLVIVGDGPLRGDLESAAADEGIGDRVLFAGLRSDIPEVLAAFDIFALSSISEGLPVSLLEAMAAGKPIVATMVGGIPEAVTDRREGLLVEPGDPEALAGAIHELACDPKLASHLGRQASEKVAAEYSIEATVRRLEEVYCSLLNKTSVRRRAC